MTSPAPPSPPPEPGRVPRPERRRLDATSWVDVWAGWHQDDGATFQRLARSVAWKQARLWRYDHHVTEPRLSASLPRAHDPALLAAIPLLRKTYGVMFDGPALAYYRDGKDALGAHRDRDMHHTSDTMVAILTFGARRPWQLTPLRQVGSTSTLRSEPTLDLAPGDGDLFVLGGRAQADWLHGVPPLRGLTAGRISVQWRWTSGTGPPEKGPGYRAPRHFSGAGRPRAA